MKIGIVGYGHAGRRYAAALARAGQEVVRVADPSPVRLAQAALALPRARTTQGVEELPGDPGLDGLLIATPLASRFPLVYEALESGKHVLLDGALAASEDEALCLAELARRQDRALLAGHPRLHAEGARRARELIRDPAAGRLLHLTCQRSRDEAARRLPDLLFGVTADEVALLCFLMGGGPSRVHALAPASDVTGQLESLVLELGFDGGPQARIQVMPGLAAGHSKLLAEAEQRRLLFHDSDATRSELWFDAGRREVRFEDPLRALGQRFGHCAEGGDREAELQAALSVVQVVEAARHAMADDPAARGAQTGS